MQHPHRAGRKAPLSVLLVMHAPLAEHRPLDCWQPTPAALSVQAVKRSAAACCGGKQRRALHQLGWRSLRRRAHLHAIPPMGLLACLAFTCRRIGATHMWAHHWEWCGMVQGHAPPPPAPPWHT